MSTPFESAQLNLKLFELRREPALREARAWFLAEFNPETLEDLIRLIGDERNASFRMVLGYWDMAASMVTTGAIDGKAFLAAHGEIFLTFAKIHPFLSQMREAAGEPEFCKHLETVVLAAPDAVAIMTRSPRRGHHGRQGPCHEGIAVNGVTPRLSDLYTRQCELGFGASAPISLSSGSVLSAFFQISRSSP